MEGTLCSRTLSMNRILLFGASGHLGKRVAAELVARGHQLARVVRSKAKTSELTHPAMETKVVNLSRPDEWAGLTEGFDAVVSCLGKSVSPTDRSRASFREVDLDINTNILKDAVRQEVRKFVYVSAFHSEQLTHLEYFRVHHEFSQRLIQSGIDYSIIKPPAIFSAFLDLIAMARKGRLVHLGTGEHMTNPIYEGDLAKVVVDSISQSKVVREVGGVETLSRRQLNELVQQEINPDKKIPTVPLRLVQTFLPLLKMMDRNAYDKFAFFLGVMQQDVVAPPVGEKRFVDYVRENVHR